MNNKNKIIVLLAVTSFLFFSCVSSRKSTEAIKNTPQSDSTLMIAKRKSADLFSDGLRERLSGNYEKAASLFERAIKTDPDDHGSMYELSDLYARNGRFDESFNLMKKAVSLQPENEWYQIRLGQLYKHQGDYEAYADIYRTLLKLKPDNVDYFSELSSALLLLEKYDEALQVFSEIEKQVGVNEMLSIQKQSIYLSKKDINGAISELEKLSDTFPFEARYHAMLAEMYKKNGFREKALERYQKILHLDVNDPYIHISLAEFYKEGGEDEKAFDELLLAFENEALEIDTKVQIMLLWFEGETFTEQLNQKAKKIAELFQKVHPESSRGYQLMADVYLRNNEYEKARSNFQKAVEIDGSTYLIWESLLFTDIQLQDFETLEIHAKSTKSLFPEQPLPYLFEGIAKYQRNDFAGALVTYETGRKFVVGNDRLLAEFFSSIGDTQHKLGNHIASDASYDKSLAIDPLNAVVLNNYAYYLSIRGEKLEEALQMAAKAVEKFPEQPSYLDTYAWIFYKKGDYENALLWIEKALQFSEEQGGTLFEHYGDILYKLGRKQDALKQWKKAKNGGETSELIDKKIKDAILYE